jgi:protein SCO1/2
MAPFGLGRVSLLGMLALLAAPGCKAREPLPVLGTVPTFSLTAQNGQPFGTEQLAGKVWVANFVFTRCTTICPPFSAKMAAISKAKLPGVALVSFSVDPEHDTPPVLEAYARTLKADLERWSFVTGTREALEAVVVKGLFQPMEKGDGSLISIGHSNRFVLVDAKGQIRGFFGANEPGAIDTVVAAAREASSEVTP